MGELSIFCDESGMQEGSSRFYLVTLVFHNQADDLEAALDSYRLSLARRGLPDIPFHATPLKRGHDAYREMDLEARKRMFVSFGVFVQRLPVRYATFSYKSREFGNADRLRALLKRDLVLFLSDHLEYFQSFETVKVYYDNGQPAVAAALRDAIGFMLAKDAYVYRDANFRAFCLAQVADYLCDVELSALKYESHTDTATDVRFFGGIGAFKRNYLKQARRKRL